MANLKFRVTAIVWLVVMLLIMISCTKKITSTSRETEIEKIRMMPVGFPPSENSYDLTIECDKQTNQPKPQTKKFKSGKTTTTATIAGNNLNIIHKTDTVFIEVPCIDNYKSKEESEIKVKEVWPWWMIYVVAYSVLVTVLFLRKLLI